jgi:hypothetical protein
MVEKEEKVDADGVVVDEVAGVGDNDERAVKEENVTEEEARV